MNREILSLKDLSNKEIVINWFKNWGASEKFCQCLYDKINIDDVIPGDIYDLIANVEINYGFEESPFWIHLINAHCKRALGLLVSKMESPESLKELKNPFYKLKIFETLGKAINNSPKVINLLLNLINHYKCNYNKDFVIAIIRTQNEKLIEKVKELDMLKYFDTDDIIKTGNKELIQNINKQKINPDDLLEGVAESGNYDFTKDLIEIGKIKPSKKVLLNAIISGNLKLVSFLIKNCKIAVTNLGLITAAKRGYLTILKYLLAHTNEFKLDKLLIYQAIESGNYTMVKYLENIYQFNNWTSIEITNSAYESSNLGIIKYIKSKNPQMPINLNKAIQSGNIKLIHYIFNQTRSPHEIRTIWYPGIDNLEIAEFIENNSADDLNLGNLVDLFASTTKGSYDVVKFILDKYKLRITKSLITEAVKSGNKCLVEYLQQKIIK